MAGQKKKKKPAANPARGFATTSIASKPRPEVSEADSKAASANKPDAASKDAPPSNAQSEGVSQANTSKEAPLSAEEFEKQLEESALQLLVEKYAEKTRRDAQRQRSRLETDRRLLRSQADSTNTLKWLPAELLDYILDLIKAESRFSGTNGSAEITGAGKMPLEEDLIARLWTLQQTLLSTGFADSRVHAAIKHILDISPNVSTSVKDSIWGLEEALDWLARECELEELPPYEPKTKPQSKGLHTQYRSKITMLIVKFQIHQPKPQTHLAQEHQNLPIRLETADARPSAAMLQSQRQGRQLRSSS